MIQNELERTFMNETDSFRQRFSIGWRAIKTAVAVFITIATYAIFNLGEGTLASLSAVFSLRENMSDTYLYAKYRIFGNTVGVLIAIFLFFIRQQLLLGNNDLYNSISGGLGVLLVINCCTFFGNQQSIINSVATFLVVFLSTPEDSLMIYGVSRIMDTIYGTIVAIIINHILPNRKQ